MLFHGNDALQISEISFTRLIRNTRTCVNVRSKQSKCDTNRISQTHVSRVEMKDPGNEVAIPHRS